MRLMWGMNIFQILSPIVATIKQHIILTRQFIPKQFVKYISCKTPEKIPTIVASVFP